jgi:uncharacterized membrane protein
MAKHKPFFPQQVQPHLGGMQQIPAQQTRVGVLVESSISAGPLPSPEIIAEYDKVLPGAANRIIKMAENEQTHSHNMQIRTEGHRFKLTITGQVFGFIIGISGVAGGIWLVGHDKSIGGFSVFFTSLAVLVGGFIYSRRKPAPKPSQPIAAQK